MVEEYLVSFFSSIFVDGRVIDLVLFHINMFVCHTNISDLNVMLYA